MKSIPLVLTLMLTTGCAYYNGMYNANRLARDAEKAEREGRTFDAASLWGQVGVKADTVLARHGSSKWADDARLLRGKSYQRLGDCNSAVPVLRDVLATTSDSTLAEEASFLLGRCYQNLGNVDEASHAFQRLVNSSDPNRRKEALYQYGRSLRLAGRYEDALTFLQQSSDARSTGERAAALAGAGRLDEAERVADSLRVAGDTTAPWDTLLALIGRHDQVRAGALTDRLLAMPQASAVHRARWLMADGERLMAQDPEAGVSRVRQSLDAMAEGPVASSARLLLVRARMRRVTTTDSLRAIWVDLEDLIQMSATTGIQLARYQRAAGIVLDAVDSVAAGASAPDLRLFLAAELVRDSLEMPRYAGVLLRRVPGEYPDSPYAAKALLALSALDSSSAADSRAVLDGQYADNPYYLASQGQDPAEYRVLEDSLFRFATTMRRPTRATTPAGRQPAPAPGGRLPQN